MNLHTCPNCQTPALYERDLKAQVSCHSCGVPFTLTRFTKTERSRMTRWVEVARLKAESARRSRRLLYAVSVMLLLFLTWSGASLFGFIPDEWRLVNRRFASLEDEQTLSQAIGLVAIGQELPDGRIEFTKFFTATAITNDGFMLTAGRVVDLEYAGSGIWVFIDGRRLDAARVGTDSIAEVGVIKVDEELRSRFLLIRKGAVRRLNVEVASIGYAAGNEGRASPLEQSFSVSRGTVSHVWSDQTGTEWIDHSAAINRAGVGGPVILDDRVAGVNLSGQGLIMKAVSVGPLRTKILRMIEQWRADSP